MIPRALAFTIQRLAKGFPVLVLTDPRQSGKATLVRHIFPDKLYVSVEAPDTQLLASSDPNGFLASYSVGAILDKVQRAPELLSYIQVLVDVDVACALHPTTIKSGQTVVPEMFRPLKKWLAISESTTRPILIFGGHVLYVREGIKVTGWHKMLKDQIEDYGH